MSLSGKEPFVFHFDKWRRRGKAADESEEKGINDSASTAYDVYKAEQERAVEEGEWEKISPTDYYGDRYEKYLSTLVKLYPDFAEEINDIFHFIG